MPENPLRFQVANRRADKADAHRACNRAGELWAQVRDSRAFDDAKVTDAMVTGGSLPLWISRDPGAAMMGGSRYGLPRSPDHLP